MRILRLDLGPTNGTVDFHPFVSVVHGLSDLQRDVLINSLRLLVRGTTAEMSGLVENGGELIELATANGDVLGPFTTEDVVVAVDAIQLDERSAATLRAELDQLRKRAECDAVHVEEIRADLDSTALAAVQSLRHELAGTTPITAAELHRSELRRSLLLAMKEVSGFPQFIYEARAEVSGVVERWNDHEAARFEAKTHLARLDRRVKDSESGVVRARDAVEDAQRGAVPVVLTADENARVEELAAIAFDRRGRRAKKRTEEEDAELANLLAKVGQETHAAYAMYRLSPQANPEGIAAVARAQKSLERAQQNLDSATAEQADDPVVIELHAQLEMVKEEARMHLGPMLPSDLGAALLALQDESENPEWVTAVGRVYDGLIAIGAEIDDAIEPMDLVPWGLAWVAEAERSEQYEKNALDRGQVEQRLDDAERSLDRHGRAMARIDRLEAAAAESEGEACELEQRLAMAQGEGGLLAEDLLDTIEPLADRVRTQAGSAAPLVLVGEFNTLGDVELEEFLEDLEELAKGVQLILVTDRQRAATWASRVGLRRALRSTSISLTK